MLGFQLSVVLRGACLSSSPGLAPCGRRFASPRLSVASLALPSVRPPPLSSPLSSALRLLLRLGCWTWCRCDRRGAGVLKVLGSLGLRLGVGWLRPCMVGV